MKRIFALILALVMCLALVACDSGSNTTGTTSTKSKADEAIEAYMDAYGDELIQSLEESFAGSSGMTCKSSYAVKNSGLILEIRINELNNVDDETKNSLQEGYDSMQSYWDSALEMLQSEVKELKSLTIRVCEKDGTLLAEVTASK